MTRNAIYNLVGQVTLLGLSFMSARFILRGLGADAFGLILFATSLSATLSGLLELGLIATTVRAVAIHRNDSRYLAEYIGTGSSLYWGLFVLLAVMGWILTPTLVSNWIHLKTVPYTTATDAVRLLVIASLSMLPRSLYASLFRGLQRMEFNNGIEVGASVMQQVGTIAILLLGGKLSAVALWTLVTSAVALSAYAVALSRFLRPTALLPGYSQRVVRQHWKFAAKLSGNQMLFTLFIQSDKLVVAKLLALSSFGYYSFVWSATWRVATLSTVINQAALPAMAAVARAGSPWSLYVQYRKCHDIVCHAWVIPMAAVAFGAWPVFRYLFGVDVAHSLLIPTMLLGVAFYMHATLTMPTAAATAAGRPEFIMRVNALAFFVFLPALVGLVVKWGLTGAGLAWLGYYGLSYATLVPSVCRHCLGVSPVVWYRHIAAVFLKLVAAYGVAWSICFIGYRQSTVAWLVGFAAATVLFVILAYPVLARSLCGDAGRAPYPVRR